MNSVRCAKDYKGSISPSMFLLHIATEKHLYSVWGKRVLENKQDYMCPPDGGDLNLMLNVPVGN